jgi:hypothetical protein
MALTTSPLRIPVDTIDLEQEGRVVAKHEPRISKFAEMLVHPEFATFFDQHFQSWNDCENSIMLLKAGAELRNMLLVNSGEEVSGHQLAALMSQMLREPTLRQYMVKSFQQLKDQQEQRLE